MWTYRASDDKKKKGPKRRVKSSVGKSVHRHSKGKGGNKYAWRDSDLEKAKKTSVEEQSETGEGSQTGTIEVTDDTQEETQDETQESQDSLLDTQDDE